MEKLLPTWKLLCLFNFLSGSLFSSAATAQSSFTVTPEDTTVVINYIPKYSWSAGIGYRGIPYSIDLENPYPDNVEIQGWLGQRWYAQVGGFYSVDLSEQGKKDSAKQYGFYGGVTMKLFLFRNAYFIPSLNLFYDKGIENGDLNWSINAGPTLAFEYFILNRFSMTADIINLSFGYISRNDNSPCTDCNSIFSMQKFLGVGVRYNFDLK